MGQDDAVGKVVAAAAGHRGAALVSDGGRQRGADLRGRLRGIRPSRRVTRWSAASGRRAAGLQPVEGVAPQASAVTYFARAIGAARAGNPATVAGDIAQLVKLRDELTGKKDVYWAGQVEIQRQMAPAWSAWAAGRKDEALSLAAKGADAEDATEKAAVSPGPLAPAREMLAEMLLEAGRAGDARRPTRRF